MKYFTAMEILVMQTNGFFVLEWNDGACGAPLFNDLDVVSCKPWSFGGRS